MAFIPKPHEIYKHFKGNLYQIIAIAEHSETEEVLVIYQALYGDFKIYARPFEMFVGLVDKEQYPDVTQNFRFELQGPDADRQKEAMKECVADVTKSCAQTDAGYARTADRQIVDAKAKDVKASEEKTPDVKMPDEKASDAKASDAKMSNAETLVEKASNVKTPDTQTTCKYTETVIQNSAISMEAEEEAPDIDPLVLEFLDADSYEERLSILAALHHRITDEMITTMSIVCDIEVGDGDTEERYESLKGCLLTLEKYECNRLR